MNNNLPPQYKDKKYIGRPILGRISAIIFWLNPPFAFIGGVMVTLFTVYFLAQYLLYW